MPDTPADDRSRIADTAAFRRFVDEVPPGGPDVDGTDRPMATGSSSPVLFGTASSVIGVVLLIAVPVLLLVAGDAAGRAAGDRILAAAAWALLGLAVVVCVAGFLRDRRKHRPVDVLDLIVVFAAVVGAIVIALWL